LEPLQRFDRGRRLAVVVDPRADGVEQRADDRRAEPCVEKAVAVDRLPA
jgi:hypothetical protein